jgi:hypothetical protein
VEQFRVLRDRYEQRIAELQRYVAQLSRDTIASIEVGFERIHDNVQRIQAFHVSQTENVAALLREKAMVVHQERVAQLSKFYVQMVDVVGSAIAESVKAEPKAHRMVEPKSALTAEVKIVEYFTKMNAIIKAATQSFLQGVEERLETHSRRHREALREIHEEYVDATTSTMKLIEVRQKECAEARCRLQTEKVAAEAAAAETEQLKTLVHAWDESLQMTFGGSIRKIRSQQATMSVSHAISLSERLAVNEWLRAELVAPPLQ